jgi:hypothetical protein
MGWFGIGESVLGMVDGVLDKVIPDAAEREAAKHKMRELHQRGELESMKTQMSAILMEAQSKDPWTSRARPSFMYVIYILILAAIPMGVLHAINPGMATNIATGFKLWLDAIPSELLTLFGVGYVGYAGSRTIEKIKGVTK